VRKHDGFGAGELRVVKERKPRSGHRLERNATSSITLDYRSRGRKTDEDSTDEGEVKGGEKSEGGKL
jgi:hypothetical protein